MTKHTGNVMCRAKYLISMAWILIALLGALVGCDADKATDPSNLAPAQPAIDGPSGTPANGSTVTTLRPILRWICTDPDGDELVYDVYFGETSPPELAQADLTTSRFDPDSLQFGTTYYWQVVAKDQSGAKSTSDLWEFSTFAQPPHLIVNKTKLDFSAVQGGDIPASQTFSINNTGAGLSVGVSQTAVVRGWTKISFPETAIVRRSQSESTAPV
jgi:hypothetical protein